MKIQIANPRAAFLSVTKEGFSCGHGGFEDGIRKREGRIVTEAERGEFGEEKARVRVGGEAGLDRFDVKEFPGG